MKINTNISLRDRSKTSLKGFKGLDTLSASVDVSSIHATEMKNLISRDGVNHKRFGWETKFRIRDTEARKYVSIKGVFNFNIFGYDFIVVYGGRKFYLIRKGVNGEWGSDYSEMSEQAFKVNDVGEIAKGPSEITIAKINLDILQDTECECFVNGNKAYFIGCGDFLVFSKWKNGYFELRRVVGNEDVYIPTTTEGIDAEEVENKRKRITAEERNILSSHFKNTLFGSSGTKLSYYIEPFLDQVALKIKTSKGVVTLTLFDMDGNDAPYNPFDSNGLEGVELITYLQMKDASPFFEIKTSFVYTDHAKVLFDKKFAIGHLGVYYAGKPGTTNVSGKNVEHGILYLSCVGEDYGEYQEVTLRNGRHVHFSVPQTVRMKLKAKVHDKKNNDYELHDFGRTQLGYASYDALNAGDDCLDSYFALPIDILKNFSIEKPPIFMSCWANNLEDVPADIKKEYVDCTDKAILYYKFGIKATSSNYTASYFFENGLLTLSYDGETVNPFEPPSPSEPNIEFFAIKNSNNYVDLCISKKACEFGTQGTPDRLFVVDNVGNIVRWSKDKDFTYFGEKTWLTCGTADKKIKGMDRLNDSTLLVVKEYSVHEPSVFVVVGNLETKETEAQTLDYYALFSVKGYHVGMGAVGELVNFNGECLMMGSDGLYAVALGENMTVDSKYLLPRSKQISNTLERFNLANAKCVSFNGKLFVSVGGDQKECFVADNKYTTNYGGDSQNLVNYEWWRWTNIPVSVWGFVDNELWFGTEYGELCCFTKDFCDKNVSRLHSGLILYEGDEDGFIRVFTISNGVKVNKNDLFKISCFDNVPFYGKIETTNFSVIGEDTEVYLPLSEYKDGEKIYIDNEEYTISLNELSFKIVGYKNDKINNLVFYKDITDYEFIISNVIKNEDGGFDVKVSDKTGNEMVFAPLTKEDFFPLNQPALDDYNYPIFQAILTHKEIIISEYKSGAMDLGTRSYSKTLTGLILTGEKDLANRLKYGLITRLTNREYKHLRANNDLDFYGLNLETVSLDSQFASSYTKRLNLRNVNFLMLYLLSDTENDIAINSVQIEYKIQKRNIGVK